MARQLSAWVQEQHQRHAIKRQNRLLVNSVDYSAYLTAYSVSFNRDFGAAAASFTLNNTDEGFSDDGDREISVGDTVEFFESYGGDSVEWKQFYGFVSQRPRRKTHTERSIELVCLDFISKLQQLDIDLLSEGTKVEVLDEVLVPNFLPPPNSSLAQVFNFSKSGVADNPRPIIFIHDLTNDNSDPQFDGFEILYEQGQLKLGSPINAFTNYEVIARKYYYYSATPYVEDVIEDILLLPDVYGNRLFGNETEAQFTTNHLTETFQNMKGAVNDTLLPSLRSSTITIYHPLTANVAEGATTISVDSTNGLPTSGEAEINGDLFTWTGKSATTLTGCSGLKAHSSGDLVAYENTYVAGQVWYLTYSNVQTDLVSGDFTGIPGGTTIEYVDKRFGRIILSGTISSTTDVQCTNNYSFKTLQASGIQLNRISFRSREIEHRYAAVDKLRQYCPPNYLIRTIGSNKIWSGYVEQKQVADYDLTLVREQNLLEDEDLFTHTIFYGKNINPTNLMFNPGVDFVSAGVDFRAVANDVELALGGEEGNAYIYGTIISGVGDIVTTTIQPVVKINGVAIDNQIHIQLQQQVLVQFTTRTETRTGCHGVSSEQYVKSHTYYYYKVYFQHKNIVSSQAIQLHSASGVTLITLSPNDPNMDYANGTWHVPGEELNTTVTQISTATYYVNYSTSLLTIDFERALFKIDKSLIIDPNQTTVTATFEYHTVFVNVFDVGAAIDGRYDTQVQGEFFAEPPNGLPFTIIDLGADYNIQAIDLVAGFYRPDTVRKFDIDMRLSLLYSTDNVSYNYIGDSLTNIRLAGGDSASFEEDDLGSEFTARYLRIDLENVKRIEYGNGIWPIAFSEIAAYSNIVLKGEATLIPTTTSTETVDVGATTIPVVSTAGFEDTASGGAPATAYIDGDNFTYTGLTATSFTGVSGVTSSHAPGVQVTESLESDTTLYDTKGLLPKLGDRVYKDNMISDSALYSQSQMDFLAKSFLKEFIKNHSRRQIIIPFAPYLSVGHTVSVDGERFFVEAVQSGSSDGSLSLTIGQYPE